MHSLYSGHQAQETADTPASSLLVIDSADRSTANSSSGQAQSIAPITQPFNNFKLQKPSNILQGGFKSLKLTEIRFPYAIPNVLPGVNDSFWVKLVRTSTNITAKITVNPGFNGFFDGDGLALAVQTALNASAVGSAASTTWTVVYQNGGIIITTGAVAANTDFLLYPINPANVPGQAPDWDKFVNYSSPTVVTYQNAYWTCATASVPFNPQTSPPQYQPPSAPNWTLGNTINSVTGNSLLNVMGFDPLGNWAYLTTAIPQPNAALYRASSWAPLTYTSYIDFVSNNLTKYQKVSDASSKTNSTGAIILRMYLNDETSTVPVKVYDHSGNVVTTDFGNAGSFPFVIHRQFTNPKTFKWNPGTSIDTVDLQLFDDTGAPLHVPEEGLPNFQITFLATEE